MSTLLRISFRNLFRQKRRNLLLGSAIAVGTLVLMVASAFSAGISKVLFERVVVFVAGHVSVAAAEKGKMSAQVWRDGRAYQERMRALPNVKRVEETIGLFCRAIGNGKSENMILVAIDMGQAVTREDSLMAEENFPMIQGDFRNLADSTIENPMILAERKAQALRVGMGDVVRVRFTDINGQNVAARLTVAGIFRPSNIFMESPMFVELGNARTLAGFGPYDSPYIYLTVEDPTRNAVIVADSIHAMLHSPTAAFAITLPNLTQPVALFGYRSDSVSLLQWKSDIQFTDTLADYNPWDRRFVFASASMAASANLKPGDTVWGSYELRHEQRIADGMGGSSGRDRDTVRLIIGGIFANIATLPPLSLLRHEVPFYDDFYKGIPARDTSLTQHKHAGLAQEWVLLPRSRSSDELMQSRRKINRGEIKGTAIDVRTMYEAASDVLKLEGALQLITFSAVLVLFFVILVGVVNTLRMTVRERTREIGTLRAIGMQKSQVRAIFLYETGLLALFSSIVGALLGLATMWGLSLIEFETQGNPLAMILVRGHIVFAPTVQGTILFILLIVGIALATAYFPARRAASLPAATALRHYE